MANTDEVYELWDSANELMCHPDIAHPVHFDIAFGQDETFEISYEGEIFILNDFWNSILGFAFDSVTGAVGGQQLQCTVQICKSDDASSPCKTGCFEATLEATTQAPTTTTPSEEQLVASSYQWKPDEWTRHDNRLFSSSCNPNFIDSTGADCATYAVDYDCALNGQNTAWTRLGWSADQYVARAVANPKLKLPWTLLWETGLQCPQCGCTDERGSYKLNDIFRSEEDDEDFWYGKWLMV